MHLWGQNLSTSPWSWPEQGNKHRCLHVSPQRRDGIPAPGWRQSLLLTEGLTSHRLASGQKQTQQSEATTPLPVQGNLAQTSASSGLHRLQVRTRHSTAPRHSGKPDLRLPRNLMRNSEWSSCWCQCFSECRAVSWPYVLFRKLRGLKTTYRPMLLTFKLIL